MNRLFAAFVPTVVVTSTLAVPAEPAGVVAVIEVALTTVMPVADEPPIVTAVVPAKPVPVIVTLVPPRVEPEVGEIALTVGAATYVKRLFAAFVPAGVVTSTLAVPAACTGVVAVIEVALTTVMPVADVPPIVNAVAPVKPVPVIVTLVPPRVEPEVGEIALTVGGATYVKRLLAAFVPPVVVTSTLAVPAACAGVVAVIELALTTVMPVAAVPPIVTPVVPLNPAPVIVTPVPPSVEPEFGEIDVTAGPEAGTSTKIFSAKSVPN